LRFFQKDLPTIQDFDLRFFQHFAFLSERNAHRNPEWWGDFNQLKIPIKQKSQSEFVPRDTSEFKPRALLLKNKKAVAVSITMVKTPIVASYGRRF